MKIKSFNVKYRDDGNGSIEGYASTWIREPDSYGDVVKEGAFTKTLAERWNGGKGIPLLWAHQMDQLNSFIGKADADEDEKGLHFVAKFDDTEEAQRVRELYKDGRLKSFSFAYDTLDWAPIELEDGRKANELRELDLFEISCVTIPANGDATMTEVKAAEDTEIKSGRRNSAKDLDTRAEIESHLKEAMNGLAKLKETVDDTDEGKDEAEANEASEEQKQSNLESRKEAIMSFIKSMEDKKMNLKEQLEAKKEELKSLDLTTEEGIKSGEALTEEITKLDSLVKKAEEVAKVKESIGTVEKKEEEEMDGIKSANLEELKTQKGSKSFALKAFNDPETAPSVGVTSQKVVDAQPALGVRDLFGTEAISGNALTFYKLGSLAGSFSTVAQGGSKPQVNVAYDGVTVALSKIAGFLKETDELLTDAAFLESAIIGRGVYEFRKAAEAFLVDSLLAVDGIQQGQSTISFDNILKAKQAVRTATGYTADALLINPADLETLLLTKDSNLQYLLGGPAYGAYGNGSYASNPRIWGLTVVESEAIEQGAAIVGAFKAGSSVVTKAGEGLRVEVSNSDQDDFIKNMVTVRIEERLALATRVPAAFALVGTVSSSS